MNALLYVYVYYVCVCYICIRIRNNNTNHHQYTTRNPRPEPGAASRAEPSLARARSEYFRRARAYSGPVSQRHRRRAPSQSLCVARISWGACACVCLSLVPSSLESIYSIYVYTFKSFDSNREPARVRPIDSLRDALLLCFVVWCFWFLICFFLACVHCIVR